MSLSTKLYVLLCEVEELSNLYGHHCEQLNCLCEGVEEELGSLHGDLEVLYQEALSAEQCSCCPTGKSSSPRSETSHA